MAKRKSTNAAEQKAAEALDSESEEFRAKMAAYEDGSALERAAKKVGMGGLLGKCGIKKESRNSKGKENAALRTPLALLLVLLSLPFQSLNLFRFLRSRKGRENDVDDNVYYRFLSDTHYNWRKLVTLLGCKIAQLFSRASDPDNCLVVDDTMIHRRRSKKVEGLSWVFDHTIGKTVRGFYNLVVGFTNGRLFLPVGFNLLASPNRNRWLRDMSDEIDKRTVGYRNRVDAIMHKPEATLKLLKAALDAGICAMRVLADTWFVNQPFIYGCRELGLDVIGMLKRGNQTFYYGHNWLHLDQLARYVNFYGNGNIFGHLVVRLHDMSQVKLVFVRNRNKKDDYIIILSTDLSLSDEEIVRLYGFRWSIENCFKVCKSLLGMGKEFQVRNYDSSVSTIAIVFIRYNLLQYLYASDHKEQTLHELFYQTKEEMEQERENQLSVALQQLFKLCVRACSARGNWQAKLRIQLVAWYQCLPIHMHTLFGEILDEFESGDPESWWARAG